MAKAIAKKVVTQEAFETALQGYVRNDNEYAALAAKRDKRVAAIDAEYAEDFARMKTDMDEDFDTVQRYCEANRVEIFEGAQSTLHCNAHIGFRQGKDKVIILDGFKEKEIVALMEKRKAMQPYLRTTVAMDKVAIIKDKPKGTAALGFVVDKEENFFLEPVKTLLPE